MHRGVVRMMLGSLLLLSAVGAYHPGPAWELLEEKAKE
eukprot:gene47663-36596_t